MRVTPSWCGWINQRFMAWMYRMSQLGHPGNACTNLCIICVKMIKGCGGCMFNQLLCFTFSYLSLISFSFVFRNKESKEGKYFGCGGRKKKKKKKKKIYIYIYIYIYKGGEEGKCVDEGKPGISDIFLTWIWYIPVGRVRQHCAWGQPGVWVSMFSSNFFFFLKVVSRFLYHWQASQGSVYFHCYTINLLCNHFCIWTVSI